jgi:large subunit ribosomal protein L17
MRHRVQKRHFNRDTKHRKHLLRNLVRELVEHGSIKTTEAKAKETRRLADKLISKARDNSIATRRVLHRFFGKRDVVNTLVDRVAPAMKDRVSGFTTMKSVGVRRGDNTELVQLELLVKPERVGTLKNEKKVAPKKEAKKATKKSAAKPTQAASKKTTTEKKKK